MVNHGFGVVYLDDNANVLAGNKLADEIFLRKDGIFNRAGKLSFIDNEAVNDFLKSFKGLYYGLNDQQFYVKRSSNMPPYKLSMLSFEDNWLIETTKPHSLVLISEPKEKFDFPEWIFKNHYKLTKTEIKVAKAIFDDVSLKEHAEQRGVKITTVRWTLDNIFSKTNTRSQKELKVLALSLY